MCVIIIKDAGQEIPYDKIRAACHHNEDGFGLMTFRNDQVYTERRFDPKGNDPDVIAKILDKMKDEKVYLHLRIRTSGHKTLNACHPFKILSVEKDESPVDLYLMHNGVMTEYERNSELPDSWFFGREIVAPLYEAFVDKWSGSPLEDGLFQHVLEKVMPGYSKILLVDGYGKEYIIGKSRGSNFPWGWASNSSYFYIPETRRSSFRGEQSWKDEYKDWWDNRTSPKMGFNGMSDSEWEVFCAEDGCYPDESTVSTSITLPKDSGREDGVTITDPIRDAPESSVAEEVTKGSHDDGENPRLLPVANTTDQTGRSNPESVREELDLPPVLDRREKLTVPKVTPRPTFLELCGAKITKLPALCSWHENDFKKLVDDYPDAATILIMDLLEALYDKPVARTIQ